MGALIDQQGINQSRFSQILGECSYVETMSQLNRSSKGLDQLSRAKIDTSSLFVHPTINLYRSNIDYTFFLTNQVSFFYLISSKLEYNCSLSSYLQFTARRTKVQSHWKELKNDQVQSQISSQNYVILSLFLQIFFLKIFISLLIMLRIMSKQIHFLGFWLNLATYHVIKNNYL